MPGRTSCARSLSDVGDGDSMPAAAASTCERADHVVGLDALDHQQRPALRADDFVQRHDLLRQVVGHRRPVRLVIGIPVVAERPPRARRRRRRSSRASRLRLSGGASRRRRATLPSARRARSAGRAARGRRDRDTTNHRPERAKTWHRLPRSRSSSILRRCTRPTGRKPGGCWGLWQSSPRRPSGCAGCALRCRCSAARASKRRASVFREGGEDRTLALRCGLRRDLRRRPRSHGGRESRRVRRPVARDRAQHPAAARAGRQCLPGRELRLPLFLRAQDDVRALGVRVRRPAGRLRHARRAVRVPHAGADRQEPADSDHPRRPRVLAGAGRLGRTKRWSARA